MNGIPADSRKLVITEKNFKTVQSLEKFYFKLRDECPFDLNQYYQLDSLNNQHTDLNLSTDLQSQFCPTTADFLFCFPTTPANQTIKFACPFREEIVLKNVFASRKCLPDGLWGVSNYKNCIQKAIAFSDASKSRLARMNSRHQLVKKKANPEYLKTETLYLLGFFIALIFISLAILVFIYF